jgi:hypothetical protein
MKDVMAGESSTDDQGVASFTYSSADASMPLLFSLAQPFDALKKNLPIDLAGQTMTMREIYENHSAERRGWGKRSCSGCSITEHTSCCG